MYSWERRGSGLRKIIDETSKLSGYDENYKPEFISSATDFRVILKNVNYVNVGVNIGVKLSKTQKLILKEITVNTKITADELSRIISVTPRTIERNLRQLKKKNLLERAGSDKNGEWIIKQ